MPTWISRERLIPFAVGELDYDGITKEFCGEAKLDFIYVALVILAALIALFGLLANSAAGVG